MMSVDGNGGFSAAFWFIATVVAYVLARRVHLRHPAWYSSPMLLAPVALLLLAGMWQVGYAEYLRGARVLLLMLGPATVAFAIPIHRERRLIRRHWKVLAIGVSIGSSIAVSSAWMLATVLDLQPTIARSLLPRSVTTPFAMDIAARIGGVPELTAVLVVVTGLIGAALGERILAWLPADARLARGCAYGMAAHGVGVARAYQLGAREGAIAGLTMVLAGVVNVLLGPLLWHLR